MSHKAILDELFYESFFGEIRVRGCGKKEERGLGRSVRVLV